MRRVRTPLLAALLIGTVALCLCKIRLNNKEGFEGVFILKGEKGAWFEVTDDLFPEEADRFVWGRPFSWARQVMSFGQCGPASNPCTNFEWNKKVGRGFIKTQYPNGSKLIICLGRFNDQEGNPAHGLFIGGDLPASDPDYQVFNKNETGMAYFDGTRYFHIWCNVNEGIFTPGPPQLTSYPSMWEFLGSDVLEEGKQGVTLKSRHRTTLNGQRINIDKTLFYQTGDTYFTLVTNLVNTGNKPVTIYYQYGDEPWLGDFGSSAGNVGWIKGKLVLTESFIDLKTNRYIGLYDFGNELIGERHTDYTGMANFIEWETATGPDTAYFSNRDGPPSTSGVHPLDSGDNRFIGLTWGPRTLKPGENLLITLAIGMANKVNNGIPVKPKTPLN